MPPDIVLTEACRPVRAAVGPVAWVVLEELVTIGQITGSTIQSTTTVRQLGDDLRLSKDTVAGALRRLIDAGIVQRVDERNDSTGRFGGSTYLLDLTTIGMTSRAPAGPRPTPSDTATLQSDDPSARRPAARAATAPPTRRTRRPPANAQLSLLDTGTDTP